MSDTPKTDDVPWTPAPREPVRRDLVNASIVRELERKLKVAEEALQAVYLIWYRDHTSSTVWQELDAMIAIAHARAALKEIRS